MTKPYKPNRKRRWYFVPMLLTYALTIWWIVAGCLTVHLFEGAPHVPGGVGQATWINLALVVLVGLTWIHAYLKEYK